MKLKKATYLSLILLTSFLVSVSLNIAFGYHLGVSRSLSLRQQTVSTSDNSDQNISNAFNFVKTESETENDLEDAFMCQTFLVPGLFSFFNSNDAQHGIPAAGENTVSPEPNPIYIAVRNFRI